MALIYLDAGHGGYDFGAQHQGRIEKDDNLDLTLAIGEILTQNGLDVGYTRVTDVYDSPLRKAQIANEAGADLFISIHRNSSEIPNTYHGVQTLLFDNTGLKAEMANEINSQLEKVGYANLGISVRRDLAVLRRTQMPALLVEVGFINSDIDNYLFVNYFDETAFAIANGIYRTLFGRDLPNNVQEDLLYPSGASFPVGNDVDPAELSIQAATTETTTIGPIPIGTPPIGSIIIGTIPAEMQNQNVGKQYQVQVGLFRNLQYAINLANQIRMLGLPVLIVPYRQYLAVRVGNRLTYNQGVALENQLSRLGYDTLLMEV